jgi:hypothetical protein
MHTSTGTWKQRHAQGQRFLAATRNSSVKDVGWGERVGTCRGGLAAMVACAPWLHGCRLLLVCAKQTS